MLLLKDAVDTIRLGADETRLIQFDSAILCHLMNVCGMKHIKSNSITLFKVLEPLGEASIQTALAITFLVNNYDFVHQEDKLLGVQFPKTILSLAFSSVSLSKGLWPLVSLLISKCKHV